MFYSVYIAYYLQFPIKFIFGNIDHKFSTVPSWDKILIQYLIYNIINFIKR